MIRSIYKDELWPIYSLSDPNNYSPTTEIPDELITRYNEANTEFYTVNNLLKELYKTALLEQKERK